MLPDLNKYVYACDMYNLIVCMLDWLIELRVRSKTQLLLHPLTVFSEWNGVVQGATYPSLLAVWQNWAPPGECSRLIAITFSGQLYLAF